LIHSHYIVSGNIEIMKNHNFVAICIMLMVVLAVQSIIGIARLGYVTAKSLYRMAKPQSPTITPSVVYAPIFEPVNEPIEPVAQIIKPIADPWSETTKTRKPRGKRSIAQFIQEEAS
jgi:hypothetical protein